MTENDKNTQNSGAHRQDPAEVKRTDQAVDTSKQPGGDKPAPTSVEVTPDTPANDAAVEVAPAAPENVVVRGGEQYSYTPEQGHRKL